MHEKGAKTDGTIQWETEVPDSWDEVILQGPHFTVATPFNKQPNEHCKNNQDYSDWDLEIAPRTSHPPHQLPTSLRPRHLRGPSRPLERPPETGRGDSPGDR